MCSCLSRTVIGVVLEAEKVKEKMKMEYFVSGEAEQDGVSTVDLSGAITMI